MEDQRYDENIVRKMLWVVEVKMKPQFYFIIRKDVEKRKTKSISYGNVCWLKINKL